VSASGQIVIAETGRLAETAAEWIATVVEGDIRERGRCAIALVGGETPRPVYERLAAEPYASRIAWRDVVVYFGDERAVPPADPRSNYRMAAETLLAKVVIPAAQVHRMEAERPDADAAAREYERLLPERLDLLLLGMGGDGHTASLFPGSAALEEHVRLVLPVTGTKPPPRRLTITPRVIARARRVAVLVAGTDKAATVARALEGPERLRELPVQLARHGTWLLDRAAAAELRSVVA
jgi:6-phosphogluconolactonase